MVCCAVRRCKNSSAKSTKCKNGVTFHRFPQDTHRRKVWETAVNREAEWAATDSSAVCSEHFNAKDFYLTESGLRRLSGEAVPTLNISPYEEQVHTITAIESVDIDSTDSEEVKQLKYKVRRLEVIAANRKKQICLMWQARKRMQRRLDRMKCMIEHLIKNKKENC